MDEVTNDLKKLKMRNCSQLVNKRKSWNDLVHRTQTHGGGGGGGGGEGEEEDKL